MLRLKRFTDFLMREICKVAEKIKVASFMHFASLKF